MHLMISARRGAQEGPRARAMRWKEARHTRWLVLMARSVTAALGVLFLVTSERSPTMLPDAAAPALPAVTRQRVVIFIIDTSDYFDAHGTYVQSVVQQQCAACDIHLVNLHGDLSILALVHALDYVQAVHQTYAASTTSLVNLSLGTYIYDEALHASVHALDTTGIS